MEIRQLRYFVALAEEGSFRRAAHRLGIAQPTLTGQIQRLERALGAELVHRSTRGVTLSAAGVELFGRAQAILAASEEAYAAVQATVARTSRVRGAVLRGTWETGEMEALLPQSAIETADDPVASLRDLREGRIEVAVVYDCDPLPLNGADVERLELLREPFWIALPEGHPLTAGSTLRWGQLRGETWIFQQAGRYNNSLLGAALAIHLGGPPAASVKGDPWEVNHYVAHGRGITLCPPYTPERNGIATRPVEPAFHRRIFAAVRADAGRTELAHAAGLAFLGLYRAHAQAHRTAPPPHVEVLLSPDRSPVPGDPHGREPAPPPSGGTGSPGAQQSHGLTTDPLPR